MKSITTQSAPAAIGPYSQAALMNDTLFISGQLGIDPKTGNMAEGFEAQARLVFQYIKAILKAADMDMSNVVKASVFLKDMNDFGQLNEIYARQFSAPYPAREAIQVARLPKDGLVEISVIAMR
ncbi:MAG: RidA family protein [Candidatus Cloacimonadaceae bacterium]|jgi:2-iminobutanoate/2-iminopropanoate deaminase|nr:RidA family protein [Candidatus Cloacimonadota bacterium]MDY0126700.1 RidA family protein [Candidatus Cloacimonadaceae bacterium]MCB5255593.1 RidA family protein [Candidatus Cloacimonadota bacterium]MCK9177421.1 RidA family protein [Candidatus Cloacimonadota bacterium]MCK9242249.1 RidA family protein [Candidatus Cloacimonadota bacterium]